MTRKLLLGPGLDHEGDDHLIESHTSGQSKGRVLIFTDSKGLSIAKDKAWAYRLYLTYCAADYDVLLLARPKYLTTFFSLINFLELSERSFDVVITNVGFVDTTPKKASIVADIIEQSQGLLSREDVAFCDKIPLSSGEIADIYSILYSDLVCKQISERLSRYSRASLLLGTTEYNASVAIERERPASFFSNLRVANRLISRVASQSSAIVYFNPLPYCHDDRHGTTLDAVHYSAIGHQYVFDILERYLCLSGVFMPNSG